MLKLGINAIQQGKRFVIEVEEDIKVSDLIRKIGTVLKDDGKGLLISCDKEGILPFGESLSGLSVVPGELLLYVRRSN